VTTLPGEAVALYSAIREHVADGPLLCHLAPRLALWSAVREQSPHRGACLGERRLLPASAGRYRTPPTQPRAIPR